MNGKNITPPPHHLYALGHWVTSRLQSIFAANTVAEAIVFANSIIPKPNHAIPIIEIFADRFWTLDSNWLDYTALVKQPPELDIRSLSY